MGIRIQGHHKQSVSGKDGKSETKEVCDFAITLELTHLLYSNINSREPFLRQVTTAGNFEKVRRGTVYATRAPGYGGNGVAEEGVPDVAEWCQRFCSSKAGLKTFSFERQVQGYDFKMLQTKITSLIRGTNYRGRIDVDFRSKRPLRNLERVSHEPLALDKVDLHALLLHPPLHLHLAVPLLPHQEVGGRYRHLAYE